MVMAREKEKRAGEQVGEDSVDPACRENNFYKVP